MGCYGDFGIVVPRVLAGAAFRVFASFNGALLVELKRRKSEASPPSEFLSLTVGFRGDSGDIIASLKLSRGEVGKLAKLAREGGHH